MSKILSQKIFFIFAGICGFFLLGVNGVSATVEFKINDKTTLNPPGYIYNADQGIVAVPADQANGYSTKLLTDTEDSFLLQSGVNNLFNNVINDPNAILGYAWSERVGWLAFSHGMLSYYPRFAKDADNSQDILKGYVWSEHSGWIQLSSDGFEASSGQTDTNWGVILNGITFSGKAWSPAIGWIDFTNVTYDAISGKFGGYACSANDCSKEDNKIYFDKTPAGITNTENKLDDWGVSRNMTFVKDGFNGSTCELLSDATCLGNSPSTSLSADSTGTNLSINFSHRLEQIGNHDLTIQVTDRFGRTGKFINSATGTETVRIKSVLWPVNCHLDASNNFVCDAPELTFQTNNNGAIADGANILKLKTVMTNGNGQAVFASPGNNNIQDIYLALTFEDTVEINQLDLFHSYDAVNYTSSHVLATSETGNAVEFTITSNGVNGDFISDLFSFAPTNTTNKLVLKDFTITITLDADAPVGAQTLTFNKTNNYPSATDLELNFSPALSATITNFNHLIENTPSVFDVVLTNHSPTQDISQIDLNTMFEGILANLIAEIKAKSETSAYTDMVYDQLQLVSNGFSGTYLIEPFNAVIAGTEILNSSLLKNSSQTLTFELKPTLVLGDQIDTNQSITFETQVAYDIAGATQTTHHKSHLLDLINNVLTSQIDIKGLASGKQIHDINTDYNINVSGGMSFEEISEAVRKNVAEITRNETAVKLTTGGPVVIDQWSDGNQIKNGTVLYYEGVGEGDLVIDNGVNNFEIADNQGSIVIIGGDVYLKSNIAYSGTGKGSFGLIVIKNKNGQGGNVYIDPSVTNIVGGIYAEGSVMSAKDADNNNTIQDSEIFDGFATTDEKKLLANQIYINGSLISRNTIGGSRQDPIEFPQGYATSSCTGGSDAQKCAERFDLNYIRNFAVNGSGAVLNGGIRATGTAGVSNSAFVIKYDARIQSNTPPGFEMQGKMDFEEVLQ